MSENEADSEFSSKYLQRLTAELSEDLDKVRNADDFKADSVPFLVYALAQGSSQFPKDDKKQIIQASKQVKTDENSKR